MTDLKRKNLLQGPARRPLIGVSGFSVYVPPFRVPLETWCGWTGNNWEKVSATVGRSFRILPPNGSVYTMAANAVLRLILDYEVDPSRIGFLGLGTESSTDNSAGAIIVKGIVDRALNHMGLPRISRQCEVPEFKHACLGGVYAQKAAWRYLATDGAGRLAIAVSADIAEYERGSSGEQTQGAGAVAQLMEENPKLYAFDLCHSASASAYRGVDFRKPHVRHLGAKLPENALRFPDYPVFNGMYSTICYTDQALHATGRLVRKLKINPRELYNELGGAFFHRPYARLPVNVMSALYIWGLTLNEEHLPELEVLCNQAGADFDQMRQEAASEPDLFQGALVGHVNKEVYPHAMKVVKHFRSTPKFQDVAAKQMHLGVEKMMDVGNIYTASLPGWIAAGFEDALEKGADLKDEVFFTLGYGSGDAAEAMLFRVEEGWEEAAARIGFQKSLEGAIDLKREEYEAIHDCLPEPCPNYAPSREFVIDRIGDTNETDFIDTGIEYYRWVP